MADETMETGEEVDLPAIRYKRQKNRQLYPDDPVLMNQIRAAASIHCTRDEAAHIIGVSPRTFRRFLKTYEVAEAEWKRGRGLGRASLRRRQYQVAMAGDPQMLKWLGKQKGWLGQSEDPAKLRQDAAEAGAVRRSRQETEARILELFARMPQLAHSLVEMHKRAGKGSGS